MKKPFLILMLCLFIVAMVSSAQNETSSASSKLPSEQTSSFSQQSSLISEVSAQSAASSVAPTTGTRESQISPKMATIYAPLESWARAIKEDFGYSKNSEECKEYPYICQSLPNEFFDAHYVYYDIDGNGIPELLIASFYDSRYCYVADIFTIYKDKPVRLFAGVEDRGFCSYAILHSSNRAGIVRGYYYAAYVQSAVSLSMILLSS